MSNAEVRNSCDLAAALSRWMIAEIGDVDQIGGDTRGLSADANACSGVSEVFGRVRQTHFPEMLVPRLSIRIGTSAR